MAIVGNLISRIFRRSKSCDTRSYATKIFMLRNLIAKVYKNRLRYPTGYANLMELDRDIAFVKGLGPVVKRTEFTKFECMKIDALYEKYALLEKIISEG